jgi:hypothetical protein
VAVSFFIVIAIPAKKSVRFSPCITLGETFAASDYARTGELTRAETLTPDEADVIRKELNTYKTSEMRVHPESMENTQLYWI